MPYVYRVEDYYKQGCYQAGACRLNKLDSHDNSITHPLPQNDSKINRYLRNGERCGFKDLNQAKAWFTKEELKRLAKNGYNLKRIKVEEITAVGERQVLFKPIKMEEMA